MRGSWAASRRSRSPTVLEQEREHLLHEERVSTRCFDDPPSRPTLRRRPNPARFCRRSRSRCRRAARAEPTSRSTSLRPTRGRSSSNSGRATQTSSTGASLDPVAIVVDEVEECRLSPVNVVEDDDERAATRKRLDERPHGGKVSSAPLSRSERPLFREPLCDQLRVGNRRRACWRASSGSPPRKRASSRLGSVAHGLEHRPVRDALAVRKTTPLRDEGAVGDVLRRTHTRRDFPTPGAPRTVKSWHERSPIACSNASSNRRRSRSRPTIGDPNRPAATSRRVDLEKAREVASCLDVNDPRARAAVSVGP